MKRLIVSIFCLFSMVDSTFASDARVATDIEFGQGTFRTRGHECFFITAQHVVEDASKIDLVTGGRKKYGAKLVREFGEEYDTAVLLVDDNDACKNSVWNKGVGLSKVLKENEQGVLKVRNDSGGLISIRVFVRENLQNYLVIEPMNPSDNIAQGYSGGTLYIDDYVAGMLLSVENGRGTVFKQSSIDRIVSLFFEEESYETDNIIKFTKYVQGDTSALAGDVVAHFEGDIKAKETDSYSLQLKRNSPILLATPKMEKGARFDLQLLTAKKKVLKQATNLGATYNEILFTPQDTGRYEIQINGKRKQGNYDIVVTQLARDKELRSSRNRVEDGERVDAFIAEGAEGEYRYRGNKNTPILLAAEKTGNGMTYQLQITDRSHKLIRQWNGLGTAYSELVFTPPKNGQYLLRFIGEKGYGSIGLSLQEIISDKKLRKQKLKLDEQRSSIMAEGAIAEYRIKLDKGTSTVFSIDKDIAAAQYNIEFLDYRYKPIKSWNNVSNDFHEFSYAPERNGNFHVRLTGTKGVSDYTLEARKFTEQEGEEKDNKIVLDEFIEGELVDNQERKFKVRMKRNSPMLIRVEARDPKLRYKLALRDPRGKKAVNYKDVGRQDMEFIFTPVYSGNYSLEFEGTSSYGEFAFLVSEITTDKALKSTDNIIKVNRTSYSGIIANGAEAVYRLHSSFDKVVKLTFEPNDTGATYDIDLNTLGGKTLDHWKGLGGSQVEKKVELPKPGVYLLKVVGTKGYGKTNVSAVSERFH